MTESNDLPLPHTALTWVCLRIHNVIPDLFEGSNTTAVDSAIERIPVRPSGRAEQSWSVCQFQYNLVGWNDTFHIRVEPASSGKHRLRGAKLQLTSFLISAIRFRPLLLQQFFFLRCLTTITIIIIVWIIIISAGRSHVSSHYPLRLNHNHNNHQ